MVHRLLTEVVQTDNSSDQRPEGRGNLRVSRVCEVFFASD